MRRGKWQGIEFACRICDVQSRQQEHSPYYVVGGSWRRDGPTQSLEVAYRDAVQRRASVAGLGLLSLEWLAHQVGVRLVFGNLNDEVPYIN